MRCVHFAPKDPFLPRTKCSWGPTLVLGAPWQGIRVLYYACVTLSLAEQLSVGTREKSIIRDLTWGQSLMKIPSQQSVVLLRLGAGWLAIRVRDEKRSNCISRRPCLAMDHTPEHTMCVCTHRSCVPTSKHRALSAFCASYPHVFQKHQNGSQRASRSLVCSLSLFVSLFSFLYIYEKPSQGYVLTIRCNTVIRGPISN